MTSNHEEPGGEPFFSDALPFLHPVQAAERILEIVGNRLAVDQAALLWSSEQGSLHGIHWQRPDSVTEVQIPLPDTAIPPESQSTLPEPLVPFQWVALGADQTGMERPRISLGLIQTRDVERLPVSWRVQIPGLLSWSLQFEQMLRDRTLAALAEYAAGAGHEINNPLGSIIGRTSQLLKGETDREKRRALETIGAQAYRIGDMIGDTMLFASPPPGRPQILSLVETVQTVLHKFDQEIAESQVILDFVDTEPVSVHADEDQLHIIVSELIKNALNALRDNAINVPRRLTIRCSSESRQGRTGGLLTLTDSGPGLTPEQQKHCFHPFYSGRQAGRGLGFGLSKCWRIVQQHRGAISLASDQGQTRAQVWLPSDKQAD